MWPFDLFTARGKALSLLRRGMQKAKKRNSPGAIADYSKVLAMPKAPDDVKAMALFNRALIYSTDKNYDEARLDLNNLLGLSGVPADVLNAAKQKLQRMDKLSR